jgi:hypothetical protein
MDVFLEVQRRLGDTDAVIELAQRRLERNPNHFQSLAALVWAYRQTGQTSRQHQTYQALIDRAEAAPIDAGMPALLEGGAPDPQSEGIRWAEPFSSTV